MSGRLADRDNRVTHRPIVLPHFINRIAVRKRATHPTQPPPRRFIQLAALWTNGAHASMHLETREILSLPGRLQSRPNPSASEALTGLISRDPRSPLPCARERVNSQSVGGDAPSSHLLLSPLILRPSSSPSGHAPECHSIKPVNSLELTRPFHDAEYAYITFGAPPLSHVTSRDGDINRYTEKRCREVTIASSRCVSP